MFQFRPSKRPNIREDAEWILYKEGQDAFPVCVISHLDVRDLVAQWIDLYPQDSEKLLIFKLKENVEELEAYKKRIKKQEEEIFRQKGIVSRLKDGNEAMNLENEFLRKRIQALKEEAKAPNLEPSHLAAGWEPQAQAIFPPKEKTKYVLKQCRKKDAAFPPVVAPFDVKPIKLSSLQKRNRAKRIVQMCKICDTNLQE